MFDEQMERGCCAISRPYPRNYARPCQPCQPCPCMPKPQKRCCHYCIDLKMEIREIKKPCCPF